MKKNTKHSWYYVVFGIAGAFTGVAAFVSLFLFIVVAVLIGEERLEVVSSDGSSSYTTLGWVILGLPFLATLGLVILGLTSLIVDKRTHGRVTLALSATSWARRKSRTIAYVPWVLGLVLVATGVYSLLATDPGDGDANIGAGIALVFGLPMLTLFSIRLFRRSSK